MVCLSRPYPFKFFKDCLPQNLLSSLLNTLSQIYCWPLPFWFFLGVCLPYLSMVLPSTVVVIFIRIEDVRRFDNTHFQMFWGNALKNNKTTKQRGSKVTPCHMFLYCLQILKLITILFPFNKSVVPSRSTVYGFCTRYCKNIKH